MEKHLDENRESAIEDARRTIAKHIRNSLTRQEVTTCFAAMEMVIGDMMFTERGFILMHKKSHIDLEAAAHAAAANLVEMILPEVRVHQIGELYMERFEDIYSSISYFYDKHESVHAAHTALKDVIMYQLLNSDEKACQVVQSVIPDRLEVTVGITPQSLEIMGIDIPNDFSPY